uniref:SFRICE_016330 n=1 Tax=Spodoptera frugiperda TaxID=7108 RepID=A0A2H1WFC3_SPOFR
MGRLEQSNTTASQKTDVKQLTLFAIFIYVLLELTKADVNRQMQDFYMIRPVDDLPLLEEIKDCKCPRIYIPICAENAKTFVNLCQMNCYNSKLQPDEKATRFLYVGKCFGYDEVTEFDKIGNSSEEMY